MTPPPPPGGSPPSRGRDRGNTSLAADLVAADVLAADLVAEGEPDPEGTPGVAASFPRKRVAAGALFRDDRDRILLLEPTYRPTWVLPGGVVEADEDPHTGCRRELAEELGYHGPLGGLLVVDWVPRHGVWGESVQFVFDGGRLEPGQLEAFRLQEDEIRSSALVGEDGWGAKLTASQTRRYRVALEVTRTGTPVYLRFGRRL